MKNKKSDALSHWKTTVQNDPKHSEVITPQFICGVFYFNVSYSANFPS
jgi:hypothetical protein